MNKQETIEYLKNNEMDVQSARASHGAAEWVYRAYSDSEKITGIPYNHVYYYSGAGADVFYQLISKDDIKKVSRKLYLDYLDNPESFKNKIKAQQKLSDELDDLWLKYSKNSVEGILDNELFIYFKKALDFGYEWWKYAVIGEDKAEVIGWEVVPRFQARHGISQEEAREAVSVLAHPEDMTFFNQERKKFLEICLTMVLERNSFTDNDFLKAWNRKEVQKKAQEYVRDFFCIKTDFYEAKMVDKNSLMNEVKDELKNRSINELNREIEKIKNNFSNIHLDKEKVEKRYVLTDEDWRDIEFSKLAIWWFDQRKLGMMRQFYYIYSMLREVSIRKKLDYHTLTLYYTDELLDLLEKNNHMDSDVLKKRESGIFLSFKNGQGIAYLGDESSELFELAIRVKYGGELRGVVASKGQKEKVRGIVNVVIRPDKNDFEEGKILVTSMTRIEFVPLMKKALAIITNEGGLACHAAIVSRELGIPAIIGTKSATKVLKNGDEIEMDMRTGEIRILKIN